jgi:hypothetical protein
MHCHSTHFNLIKHICKRSYVTLTRPYAKAALNHSSSEKDKPVILLLSWLGAKAANVEKYAQLYRKLDCTVITCNPNTLSPLIPYLSHKYLSQVCDLAESELSSDSQQRLVIHCLSNLGAYNYAALVQYISNSKKQDRVKLLQRVDSVIFDSAPSELNLEILTRGYSGFLSGQLTSQPQLDHPYINALLRPLFTQLLKIKYFQESIATLQGTLYNCQLPNASLIYLYSTADSLIPAQSVMKFYHSQVQHAGGNDQNNAVMQYNYPTTSLNLSKPNSPRYFLAYNFLDSEHVQHYRKYPAEYVEIIKQLIFRI